MTLEQGSTARAFDTSTLGPVKVERPRLFPLMLRDANDNPARGAVRWEVAELFRRHAERNHHQTLERLAERGGLSPFEAACALAGSDLFNGIKPDQRTALVMLAGAAHALDRQRERQP